jgi:hypothetical protein
VAIVQQLPRQAEQQRRGFARTGDFGVGRTGLRRAVDPYRETPPAAVADLRPGLHDLRAMDDGNRRLVQALPPLGELLLDPARALLEVVAGPDGVFLQIPAQLLGLDRPRRRDQPPALRAADLALADRGRLIDQAGTGGGAADTVALLELQVAQFEDEFLQRLGPGLRRGSDVGRQAPAKGDEDRVHRGVDTDAAAASVAADGDVDRLLIEKRFQYTELGVIERQRDDREAVLAAVVPGTLFLHRQRVAQLLADPFRLQGVGADQHGVGRRAVDRLFYFRPQRVAAAQLARIDPSWLAVVGKRGTQFADEGVVRGAVGDEEFAHGRSAFIGCGLYSGGRAPPCISPGPSRTRVEGSGALVGSFYSIFVTMLSCPDGLARRGAGAGPGGTPALGACGGRVGGGRRAIVFVRGRGGLRWPQRLFGTAASSRESVLVSNHSCHNRLAVRNDCSYRKDL